MKHVCRFILLISQLAFAGTCPTGQMKDESSLLQLEQNWAHGLERHDADAVGCILADEFQDVEPDGEVRDRASSLAHIEHRRPGHNQLSEMAAHVYGDFGYVRGLNTVLDADGKALAKVRFTDIFVYRDGRWLAVAAQESLVAEQPR